jgi:hypothetical protein
LAGSRAIGTRFLFFFEAIKKIKELKQSLYPCPIHTGNNIAFVGVLLLIKSHKPNAIS